VALLLGPWLVWRVSRRARLLMAAVLFAGGWLLALQWAPHHAFDKVLRYLLVGSYPGDVPHNFPLLHWLGVFIAASVLGQWMGERLATGRQRSVERALLLAGGSAVSSVVLYKVGQWTLAMQSGPLVAVLGSPWRKLPPSPAYLLFYGGLALLLLATALIVERRRFAKAAFAWASLVGRTSFFVFIVQFYVYYVLLLSLNLPYTPFWPLLFVASLAGITLLAKVWDDGAMNRHLSVGLRQFSATRMGRLLMASVRTRPRLGRAASTLRGDIA